MSCSQCTYTMTRLSSFEIRLVRHKRIWNGGYSLHQGGLGAAFLVMITREVPCDREPWREAWHLVPSRSDDLPLTLVGASWEALGPSRLLLLKNCSDTFWLQDPLDAGCIQPSKALYSVPVLFQKKKDGSLCMCVEYRALNKIIIKKKYLIPLIAYLFDQLGNVPYFLKLDLPSGYYKVSIDADDKPKIACVTWYGAFESLVIPIVSLTHLLHSVCFWTSYSTPFLISSWWFTWTTFWYTTLE